MVVELDPQLMDVLACPCPEHGELRAGTAVDPDADALTCGACGRSFPVTDGIPVLLLDEALPGTGPSGPTAPADPAAPTAPADPTAPAAPADPAAPAAPAGPERPGAAGHAGAAGGRGDPGGDGTPR